MEFDAFTIVAQVLNFAVLLFVLKRFLYQPVLNAMDRRESAIDERLSEAENLKEEAEKKVDEYEEKLESIETEREERLRDLRSEVDEESRRLHHDLRERVDKIEKDWRESLVRDGRRQLEEYRDTLEAEVVATVRDALESLADRDLDTQLMNRFLQRVDDLDDDTIATLIGSDEGPRGVKVVTAFELEKSRRDQVQDKLENRLGEGVHLTFEIDPDLVAGVELRCAGHRVGWSIDDYLDALQRRLNDDLRQIAHGEVVDEAIEEAWDARPATT